MTYKEFFGQGAVVHKFIQTEDDGSYEFQASDFEDIPTTARVTVHIARGKYEFIENDLGKTFGIISGSTQFISTLYN